jgi:hypothetical protein
MRTEERRSLVFATGIFFIGMGSPWYGEFASFLSIISFGFPIADATYIRINCITTPFALIGWVFVVSDLFAKRWQTIALGISSCWSVLSITIIELDYATMSYFADADHFDLHYTGFAAFYLSSVIFVIFVTGIWLVSVSLKNRDRPEIRLKGLFLLVAVCFAAGGSTFDLLWDYMPFFLVVSRLMLIGSLYFFYVGFYLPKRIQRALLPKLGE